MCNNTRLQTLGSSMALAVTRTAESRHRTSSCTIGGEKVKFYFRLLISQVEFLGLTLDFPGLTRENRGGGKSRVKLSLTRDFCFMKCDFMKIEV